MILTHFLVYFITIHLIWTQTVCAFDNSLRLSSRQYMVVRGSHPDSSFLPKVPSTKPKEKKTTRELIAEMSEPLLDLKLIKSTIEEWSKPLPSHYFSSPLVLVGPSGVGKGRLVKSLLKDYSRFFKKVVTHTTRQPRKDEIPGTSYHYVSLDTFKMMVASGEFLEWAQVHDNYYGTTIKAWQEVQTQGKIAIMEIDVQGAKSVKNLARSFGIYPKFLFVRSVNLEVLHERLIQRGSETPEQISLRLRNAEIEIAEAQQEGLFDYILTNSDNFEATSNAFFRLMRTWYRALPSASRIRMLQRRIKNIRMLASTMKEQTNTPGGSQQENMQPASEDGTLVHIPEAIVLTEEQTPD